MPKRGQPLAADKIERIIELKLDQMPVRDIAKEVGCVPNTVVKHWHDWLDRTSEERREHLERHRSEVIARLQSVAARARGVADVASARVASTLDNIDGDETPKDLEALRQRMTTDMNTEVRALGEERQAWRALSTVAGFDAPTKVALASFDTMSEDEARAALDKL